MKCFGPRFYTPLKLQKMHSNLKKNKQTDKDEPNIVVHEIKVLIFSPIIPILIVYFDRGGHNIMVL